MNFTHAKCGAWKQRNGYMLICGKSAGHWSPQCYDPNKDETFMTNTADGMPKRKGPK